MIQFIEIKGAKFNAELIERPAGKPLASIDHPIGRYEMSIIAPIGKPAL